MRTVVVSALFLVLNVNCDCAGQPATPAEGEGEGEGEGDGGGGGGEGEGEGDGGGEGEGEGDSGGEGEGEPGDGSGAAGDFCDADDDCQQGLQCAFYDAGGFLSTHCAAPTGTGAAPGSPCSTGADCDRGLCINSQGARMCSAPCAAARDCASTQSCETRSVTIGNVGGVLDVCVANGNLPQTSCQHDADCASTGRLCNELVQNGANLDFICGFPGGGSGRLGDPCSGALENDDDCATGLCDGDTNGICTVTCTANTDCGPGFICTGSGFTNVPGRMCGKPCIREADCVGDGRACRLSDNVQANRVDLVCREHQGALPSGSAANSGGECQSGFLLIQTINNVTSRFCTEFCVVDGDCPAGAGLTKCVDVSIDKPAGGTQTVQVCGR